MANIQPNAERIPVMLSIFAPELSHLDSAGLADHLRDYARTHTTEGIFNSRHDVGPFMQALIRWLTLDLGLTDQDLFEQLDSIVSDISDQYRPWSPEYEYPLTNREAQALLAFGSLEQARDALLAYDQNDWRSRTLVDWLPSHPQDPPSLQYSSGDIDAVITQVEYDQLRAHNGQ